MTITSLELDSVDIAKHIAYLCSCNNFEYNNTKIQKLLYICYGIFLAKFSIRLTNEIPKAWPYGPVFPRVFNYINKNKGDYKKQMIFCENMALGKSEIETELENIIKCFGKYNAGKLSAWSHMEGSPWDKVVDDISPQWGINIEDEIIKSYFAEKVLKNGAEKQ